MNWWNNIKRWYRRNFMVAEIYKVPKKPKSLIRTKIERKIKSKRK